MPTPAVEATLQPGVAGTTTTTTTLVTEAAPRTGGTAAYAAAHAAAPPHVQASARAVRVRQAAVALRHQVRANWRDEQVVWQAIAEAEEAEAETHTNAHTTTHVTALTYEGMEVWVGTTHGNNTDSNSSARAGGARAYLCLARTPCLVLQTLQDWPSTQSIVAVRSHPASGQIVLVGAAGRIQSYAPQPAEPTQVSLGRYRWLPGAVMDGASMFGTWPAQPAHTHHDHADHSPWPVDVALSANGKILVAAGDQLAVWDAAVAPLSATNNNNNRSTRRPAPPPTAALLWMTRLPAPVRWAVLSGDGQAICVVTEAEDDHPDASLDGVHTFERDAEDGGPTITLGVAGVATSVQRTLSEGSGGAGILYKPGPFLVHSAPVTRLAFRGQGFLTSRSCGSGGGWQQDDPSSGEAPGNDLLLTQAADGTARIFGQDSWKPLTEWVTGLQTRVDWIRGQAAFSLGDLEAKSSSKQRGGRGASRTASRSSLDDMATAASGLGQRSLPNTIPSHTTPLSQAGAWIAEISWDDENDDDGDNSSMDENPDGLPTLSLSRLTYLKRGTGDLTPTLLESVSTLLPPVSVMKSSVLQGGHPEDSLQIEGLWPAWNPFVDVPTADARTNKDGVVETLRGSAMAFLGLAQTDGYFGDALLQGTQCPPTELRLTAAHPVTGLVVVLEFSLHGQDKNLNALELGQPHRSLVSLRDVQPSEATSTAVTPHGNGQLWAQVSDGQRVLLHWRQPGSLSLVPAQWLPTDITAPTETVASILSGTQRFRDESLLPAPLGIRPHAVGMVDDPVKLLQWWPICAEELPLHGPRVLVAWLASGQGTLIQVLPPMGERTVPENGASAYSVSAKQGGGRLRRKNTPADTSQSDEYDVSIAPDPDHGLGLRLESLDDGDPAIAGSFKKNPITGSDLPAERTGLITVGDELVSANGVNLEDKTFDEIINTVREFGASSSPGNPIRMRFRRKKKLDRKDSTERRSMEQIIGVSRKDVERQTDHWPGETSSVDISRDPVGAGAVAVPLHESFVVGRIDPLEGLSDVLSDVGADKRIILMPDFGKRPQNKDMSESLLIFTGSDGIQVHRLSRPTNSDSMGQVASEVLGSLAFPGATTVEEVKAEDSQIFMLVGSANCLRAVVITLNSVDCVDFSCFDISQDAIAQPESLLIRSHSIHLVATSELESGQYRNIAIWTPRLHPGCDLRSGKVNVTNDHAEDYTKNIIHVEASSDADNFFVDFCFARSGFLDSSPLLLTFSKEGVSAYQRRSGSYDWSVVTTVLYGYSTVPSPLSRPAETFPHLLSAVRACFSSHDEDRFLRSDWHPDSILAQICTDENGVQAALSRSVRSLFLWLASEGRDLLESHHTRPLVCSPLSAKENVAPVKDSPNTEHGHFSFGTQDKNCELLEYFRDALATQFNSSEPADSGASVLGFMDMEDRRILLAIVNVVLNPPPFKDVDLIGEHFLFSAAILDHLRIEEVKEEKKKFSFEVPGVLQRGSANKRSALAKAPPVVASTACVSALVSLSQDSIVEAAKGAGVKLDWKLAKKLRIPLWMRSDTSLARAAEEIGQSMFRETKDIMECAIFFIIARKLRTLRNLAATDRTDSGRLFFKFITSHDFASERGRRAAEKNAFSLLRKNRHRVASAFFLLAEPPALQSALETIYTKLHDADLALLVARLVESKELSSGTSLSGLSGGAAMGFGSVMGGGGGFAGSGAVAQTKVAPQASETFEKWRPACGKATQKLLTERLLPGSSSDPALSSIFLLWLNKREEGLWWLSGFLEASPSADCGYRFVDDAKCRLFRKLKDPAQRITRRQVDVVAVEKANTLIDFTSPPLLLRAMKASARAQRASALLVCDAMIVRGVDAPSLWNTLRTVHVEEVGDSTVQKVMPATNGEPVAVQSSIFDDFDMAPPSKPEKSPAKPQASIFDQFDTAPPEWKPPSSGHVQSSIFDDFDRPPPPKPSAMPTKAKSIFDAFDAPQPPTKVAPSAAPVQAQSSILDTFNTPAQPQKSGSGTSSSIFDSFDVPVPQKTKAAPSGAMQSSIFDSYTGADAAGAGKKKADVSAPLPSAPEPPKKELVVPEITLCLSRAPLPATWSFLSDEILLDGASRRLCRQIASVMASFHGDPEHISISTFFQALDSYIPHGGSNVLQMPCDVSSILSPLQETLHELSASTGLSRDLIVNSAIDLLSTHDFHHRSLFAAVLNIAMERMDAAEAIVRCAAESVLYRSFPLAAALDDSSLRRQTRSTVSSLHLRREAVRTCWQLEMCLWLHRGGGLPLSSLTLKEAILAVRMGLAVGSWNRHHGTLEAILRCEPDCLLDDDAGRYLWSSLKDATPIDIVEEQAAKTTSGGWEFLVDCRRTEATEMLRECPTGSFIIRPHPSDHGVFTLSFKTNLVPSDSHQDIANAVTNDQREDELSPSAESESRTREKTKSKSVKKDDVVQHAIVRLSDSGFRCGSFGPFSSLIDLLEAVSSSLPFHLRFDLPPQNRVIREEGSQPSPNTVLFRKLALARADSMVSSQPAKVGSPVTSPTEGGTASGDETLSSKLSVERERSYSCFLELLVLSRLRRQLSSIASVKYSDEGHLSDMEISVVSDRMRSMSLSDISLPAVSHQQSQHHSSYWILHTLLSWCRSMEVRATIELTPQTSPIKVEQSRPISNFSEKSIEMTLSSDNGGKVEGCDSVLRRLIQRDSGIEFSTLRLIDGGDCTMVVLFSKAEAIKWLRSTGTEESEEAALHRLSWMENERVIEAVDLSRLPLKHKPANTSDEGIRYRIVDPWEVEAVTDRDGETRSACLGRQQYHAFSLGKIALACENDFRRLGGLSLLELWTSSKGGVIMSRALASAHPPWERSAGGDLQVTHGSVTEPEPFDNAIRQHLYRNSLFRRLGLPQRFMALLQVELLDLKNLTSPTGSLSLSVYGLLRLKRKGSTGALANKTRTLDTASTHPVRLSKPTPGAGPHAPATWGSVVRFRFPLPEGVAVDGASLDADRESLFRGPPSVLQLSVYEKKLLVDTALGTADIGTDGLWAGGQVEEWVPLRSEKHGGIHWFARIRLTLRFELMCLSETTTSGGAGESAAPPVPSVGLGRIASLTQHGGAAAHEDHKRSMSSPDLLGYLESMVY
jgi:hypothetical protein